MDVRELLDKLTRVSPRDVTVLSGAGLSVDGPSSLPTGPELTDRIVDAFFLPGTLGKIRARHAAVDWFDKDLCPLKDVDIAPRPPRLETVLGVAARIHGARIVERSTADMAAAEPNRLHHFFAQHLGQGGGHLTANFDVCVERAAAVRGLTWSKDDFLHFHGSIGGSEELGATLAAVEKGFTPQRAAEFLALLTKRPVLLVAGYRGSDFFDVNTAIAALPPNSLRGLRVIWLQHSDHDPHTLPPRRSAPDERELSLFDILHRQGARLAVVCGRTASFLRELAQRWHFSPLSNPPPRALKTPVIDADPALLPVASFSLYLHIGLFDDVVSLFDAVTPLLSESEARSARSAALWEAGRWNDVRRLWGRARPRSSTERHRCEPVSTGPAPAGIPVADMASPTGSRPGSEGLGRNGRQGAGAHAAHA